VLAHRLLFDRRMLVRALPVLMAVGLVGCATDGASDEVSLDDEDGEDYDGFAPKADTNNGLGGPISFGAACTQGPRVTIGAVGDVLLHAPLQRQAVAHSDRFRSLWSPIADLLARADTMYANHEGPSAHGVNRAGRSVADPGFVFDDIVYSSYPQFNYHKYLDEDLVASGFDVVSTANNHSLDRHSLGADRTLDALVAAGLPYTGTRRSDGSGAWYATTEANGITVGWIACTFSTNGIPDRNHQVLGCWSDESIVRDTIRSLRSRVDAVVITPHWGEEYTANPSKAQRDLAHRFLDAGATLVLGAHPHVLQPWEKYKTADGRETFVIYSLGNFVSSQTQLARRSTILLYVGLTKTASGIAVNGVRYIPMIMNTRDGVKGIEAIDRAGGNAEARRLITSMFGTENLIDPAAPLSTTPGCGT
jgi:poly-gamma-glutamate synthesis protein (capsule biosynthesis protein)